MRVHDQPLQTPNANQPQMPMDNENAINMETQTALRQEANNETPIKDETNVQNLREEGVNHEIPKEDGAEHKYDASTNGLMHKDEVEDRNNKLKLPSIVRNEHEC